MHRALVVAVVVLAGCGGFAGQSTPSVTPAPVPAGTDVPGTAPDGTPPPATDARSTRAVSTVAPGVTRETVVDPLALVEAHLAALERTNYTVRTVRSFRYPNGTLRSRRTLVTRAADARNRFVRRVDVAGLTGVPPVETPPGRIDQWSNGVVLVERVRTGGTTTYRTLAAGEYDRVRGFYMPQPNRDALFVRLSAVETRVTPVERDGRRHYRIEATNLSSPGRFAIGERAAAPRNLTLWLRATPAGVIREIHVTYTGRLEGERVTVIRRVRYTDIGETTVDRPAWVTTARNATGS